MVLVCSLTGCLPDFAPDVLHPSLAGDAGRAVDAPGSKASTVDPVEAERATDAGTLAWPEAVDGGPSDAASPALQDAQPRGCDLSGRWMASERLMSTALGAQQILRSWWYLELAQEGEALRVARSVSCGQRTTGLPPFTVDDQPAWPAYARHATYEGRMGTVTERGDACEVSFEQAVVVRGASVEAYRDLRVPLPTADTQATDSTPGWEDWDEDDKPGVTVRMSGTITGLLYLSSRYWTQLSGSASRAATHLKLPTDWMMERSTLGIDGSPLLASSYQRDPDDAQHFTELARLAPEQAEGDVDALCERIRELATTLTPDAMK